MPNLSLYPEASGLMPPAQASVNPQNDAPLSADSADIEGSPRQTPSDAPGSASAAVPGLPGDGDSVYACVCALPVLEAAEGIRFDFNEGLRVQFPATGGPWHLTFRDLDSGVILFDEEVGPEVLVTSTKKYYVRFRVEIFHQAELNAWQSACAQNPYLENDESAQVKPFFRHDYDASGREVMIQLPVSTLGDTLGWFPYVEKFRLRHRCRVLAVMLPHLADLFRAQYPEITFITREQAPAYTPYACYYLGLFFRGDTDWQPCDFRYIGLHRTAGWILGVDPTEQRPRLKLSAPRRIREPYVCIATQSSCQAKYWNNPRGWFEVISFLRQNGYRVLCLDRERVYGEGLVWNHIPYGAEDFTGNRPLQERIDLIKDADFFIGVSSGLSWLAWGCEVPVVMISGFTHPTNEFDTPYRIINFHTCNSCWNDMRVDFDHHDFLWCPRQHGTARQFECSRLISAEQVINTISRIPVFAQRLKERGKPSSAEI